MKANIHPKYYNDLKTTCSCGNVIMAGSTKEKLHTEICSACHPFYTGQQKLVDTAGRVDKFMARVKKAQQIKEKNVKKNDKDLDELLEAEQIEIPVEEEIIPTAPEVKAKKTTAKKTASKPAKVAAVKPAKPAPAKSAKTATAKPVKAAKTKAPAKKK